MTSNFFDLTGKTALVTGARTGIGFAIARGLAEHGADIITVSSAIEPGSEIELAVTALGRKFKSYKCDFKNREQTVDVCKKLEEERIDILVNNSGLVNRASFLEHSEKQWDETIEADLTAPYLITKAVTKQMVERKYGKIIFIGSMWSFLGGQNVISYTAAKTAIAGLTRGISNELAPLGVRVNAIAPGFIKTDINKVVHNDADRAAAITSRIPMGHWGQPSDLTGAAIFLSAPASDYITGVVLPVDGGFLAN
ncbi:MAG: SDR family oxidoreductase [Actinobacteria bacterium]|nr:SDR family oxidoreductase [Actinomycetota bacterium]